MSVTSANTQDLAAFVNGTGRRAGRLATSLQTAVTKANAVSANSSFNHPSTPSLQALGQLLDTWVANGEFVRVIHDELVAADRYDGDGVATVSNTAIDAALKAKGLDKAPDLVEVDAIVMYGQPPYSGWVDDPINLANGNFLLRDGDLQLFGVAAALSVVRSYSSRDRSAGVFGPGWSCVLDASLAIEEHQVTYRSLDGGGAVFRRREDGTWTRDDRRDLTLTGGPAGWQVQEGHHRTWRFDGDGVLRTFTAGQAEVVLDRGPATVVATERSSGRSVTYHLGAGGVVERVESSDGRTVTYERDEAGHLSAVRRARGDVTYEHDDAGFLAAVVDADGIVVCRNEYDAAGRVLAQVERHDRQTRYEYRADGVSTVTASDGAPPNVMVHDRRGRMTAMFDGLGNAMRLTYDDRDHLVRIVQRSGATTRFAHDERGNVVERIDPDGATSTFEWDEADRLVVLGDRAGGSTRLEYEGTRRVPARIVQPDGAAIEVDYDDLDLITAVTDADGVTTRMQWNRDGLLEVVEDALGQRLTVDYDPAGRARHIDAPDGRFADLAVDAAGRVAARRTADGEEHFSYTAAGRMTGGRDAAGFEWQAVLDAAGDVGALTDAAGPLVAYERDTVGQVVATVAADGGRALIERDPLGRPVATVDAEGHRTEVGYDPDGRPVQVTDPTGAVWSRDLDALGRTTMAAGPDGGTWLRSYHPNGELATISDPAGRQWSYDVDAMGRVVAATDPLGATTTYRYTPGGRLAEVRSPLGRVQRREYDAAGRLAKVVEADGTEVLVEDGRPVSAPTALGEARLAGARFERDGRGLLERVVDAAGVATELRHDATGRLVAQSTAGDTVTFERDRAGQVVAMTDPYGHRIELGRDERGAVDRIARPDGTTTLRTFGPDGRLLAAHDADGTVLVEVGYDEAGEVMSANGPDGSALRLRRDAAGRTTEVATDGGVVRYGWDADGYLTSVGADGGEGTRLDWSADGRLTAFVVGERRVALPEPVDVERDAAGRVVVDERGRRHDYDAAGRLVATTVEGRTTAYGYDERGLLAVEQSGDGSRTYRYGRRGELAELVREDGVEVRLEHDATGRRTREVRSDGSAVSYGWDALGRLTSVTRRDAAGRTTTDHIRHDPVGRPAVVNDLPVLWDSAATGALLGIGDERYVRWAGQVLVASDPEARWSRLIPDDPWGDDGGRGLRLGYRGELALDNLLFLGARVYDTATRSFLSPDPLPPVPGALTFAGVYSYAWNDPVNLVDPSGRRPLSDAEYDAWVKENTKGFFREIGEGIAQDPWKFVAKAAIVVGAVVVMAVATATLGPVGVIVAGAVVGALSGGLNAKIDGGSWEDVAWAAGIGGVFGGATAGLSQIPGLNAWASNAGRQAVLTAGTEYPSAYAQEAVSSYRPNGDGRMDWGNAFLDGTMGTAGGLGGSYLDSKINFNGDFDDLRLGGEAPRAVVPDATSSTRLAINRASAADLEAAHGIGPALSRRIVEARNAAGGFDSAQDLLDIPGIGPARLQALVDAGFGP